ncbi:MAG: adenylate/guanylate cyclase domain-containing protein [Betaproteobacteria bacterium]|nr:adenylate/guanylate cyclase domain-containing protein [Betaproteobacteria bacterium]
MAELSGLPGEATTWEINEQEEQLKRSLLIFACAFMTFAVTFWLAIYWMLGTKLSSNVPLAYQAISVTSLVYYHRTRDFVMFRFIQLCLFLFAPFIMQWSMGSSVTSSGAMLWALLAPLGAVVAVGWRESIPWFIAYIVLTVVSGFFDYFLGAGLYTGIPLKTIGVFFALNFAAMSSIIYFLLRYFVLESERMKSQLGRQHKQLVEEQEKSERLLCNVLPNHIAQRLKSKPGLIADGYADVTVMFADIVNFTQLTEEMSPEQMVDLLNTVFSWFDSFSERYSLEKIKTIGDAYMVVGGLICDNRDYVRNIADMALEIREFVASHPELVKHNLAVHIGIATGPVVAGVIGTKRIIYDLWGDTVNIASRLTDEATGGHIQVDKTTYNRLRKYYQFDPPGITHLKGKGDMDTYRLIGKIPNTADD